MKKMNPKTKSPKERLVLPTTPEKRALTLLIQLWRVYDAGGISVGRCFESVLLEAAIDLLGEPDHDDIDRADSKGAELVNETRDYLSAIRLKEYNEKWGLEA